MTPIKNLVKFAAKIFEMGKDTKKAKAKPVAKSKSKTVAKKGTPKAAKKTAKPVKKASSVKAKKVVKPVKKATPVKGKKVTKVAKKTLPAKSKKVIKPLKKGTPVKVKKVVKPIKKATAVKAKKSIQPVKKAKPIVKKAVKPVVKKTVKKVAKKAAKPVVNKQGKVVAKKTAKPLVKKSAKKSFVQPKPIQKKIVKQVKPAIEAKPISPVKTEKKKKSVKTVVVKPEPVTKPENGAKLPREINVPKMRYSDEDLKEFKDLIEGKLTTAREELKNLKEALDNHTDSQAGNKAWNMEEGTDSSEMEYLMNQISRQHQYIRNLELALIRVENKTYGICRVTGRLIPKERLRVVPHATMSLEAKVNRKVEETSPGASAVTPPNDFAEGFEE